MTLIKKPFVSYRTEEEKTEDNNEMIKIRLNAQERALLDKYKVITNQPKDSTALKDALEIAFSVVGTEGVTNTVLRVVLGNRKRAERLGIPINEANL